MIAVIIAKEHTNLL